jgi:hypothetical protein
MRLIRYTCSILSSYSQVYHLANTNGFISEDNDSHTVQCVNWCHVLGASGSLRRDEGRDSPNAVIAMVLAIQDCITQLLCKLIQFESIKQFLLLLSALCYYLLRGAIDIYKFGFLNSAKPLY